MLKVLVKVAIDIFDLVLVSKEDFIEVSGIEEDAIIFNSS